MPRRLALRLLAPVALVVACSFPTDMCGCPPARTAVVVLGRVVDAAEVPVPGARVSMDGVPPSRSAEWPMYPDVITTTDAAGGFGLRAYGHGVGTQALRAAVVRPGGGDSTVVLLGPARFRMEGGPLDTARVTVRLP